MDTISNIKIEVVKKFTGMGQGEQTGSHVCYNKQWTSSSQIPTREKRQQVLKWIHLHLLTPIAQECISILL